MSLNVIPALCAAILALATSGCDDKSTTRLAQFLGESPALEGMGQPPTAGTIEEPSSVAYTPPPADLPEYVKWETDPNYVCHARFGKWSCLDDGRPVYVDGAFNQLPFGVMP